MDNNVLIIFIKNPVLGKVKTRLANAIGEEKALIIYAELLDITRNQVLDLPFKKYLFYSEFIDGNDHWPEDIFTKEVQSGADLGKRMCNAFRHVLSNASKAVIIGSDCPELSSQVIEKAFFLLDSNDVVIGPSSDGGYYLLGMKALHIDLFSGISWSSSEVLSSSITKLEMAALSYSLLEVLDDIDQVEDLEKWRKGG
ncbi:MAG TPA: TIGR04282 family arsenosugar biosynthesis glycosyltransferase [Saprospiraceae bacterium]|nr:TIGR04282 family arsenosugar biosynthesis glycosyltransferase [Saprospiraceae bacterium]